MTPDEALTILRDCQRHWQSLADRRLVEVLEWLVTLEKERHESREEREAKQG